MPKQTFSLEEVYEPLKLVPAKRTTPAERAGILPEDEDTGEVVNKTSNEHHSTFKTIAQQFGATISSLTRTPEKNKRVGGVKNSQHISGSAGDFVAPKEKKPALMEALRNAGYEVIDEGDHIHSEVPRGGLRPKKGGDVVAGGADEDKNVQPAAKTTFSLDEIYGAMPTEEKVISAQKAKEAPEEDWWAPAIRAGKRTFETVMDRIAQDFPSLQSDEELAAGTNRNIQVRSTGEEGQDVLTTMAAEPSGDRELRWKQMIQEDPSQIRNLPKDLRHLAPNSDLKGFVNNLENPLKLITEDSLPANFLSYYANLPERARKQFDDARKIQMQENIVANPKDFPKVAVQAAKQAIEQRKAKQDPGVGAMWDALKQSAKDDPGKFAATFVNALVADPEMLAAPAGIGTKLIQGTRAVTTGAKTTSRVIKLADQILDAGATTATLNTLISAQDQLARSTHLNKGELEFAAASGAILGGALGGIFAKGAKAKIMDPEAAKLKGTYDELLRDQARYDVEVEAMARKEFDPRVTTEMQKRINDMLGITSKTDRDAWIAQRRKEVKSSFKDDSDYADYLSYLAEERVDRAASYAAEREAQAAARSKTSSTESAYRDAELQRSRQFSEEFDKAIAARDNQELAKLQDIAEQENIDLDLIKKAGEDEVFEAALDSGVPAIRNALNRAARRDAMLARPKWQRGEVDPELATRLGLGTAGVAAGVLMSPEDHKVAGGILGGLLGLFIPGGGRVIDRMKQSGAVSPEGNILGLVLKEKKLPNEADVITKAKQGDQQAFKQLYEQYFPRLERSVRQYVREAGPQLGVDAGDVAQEAFVKAFQNLDSFKGDSEFYTWLHSIARNEGLQAIRKTDSRINTTSMFASAGDQGPGSARAGHITEGDAPLVKPGVESRMTDIDTPENVAIANEVNQQLTSALEKMPKILRETVELKEIEGFTEAEIAKQLGIPLGTVKTRLMRGREIITNALEKGYGAKRITNRTQQGEVDPRLLKAGGVAALGGTAGAFLADENKKLGATIGALGLLGVTFGGRSGKPFSRSIIEGMDYLTGPISTRMMNISKPIWRRAIEHERVVLRDVHKHMKEVDPFLVQLNHMKKETKDLITRAILTGDQGVATKLIDAIGDTELSANWRSVRKSLDSLGDQLVHLKRFKGKELDYFPRIVKDYEGLLRELGKESANFLEDIIKKADATSIRERGTGLTELERSLIINKALMTEPKLGGQPGFAKNRKIKEITPELQKYYATPTESLHSYIRSAVEDIERARFFGKDLKVVEKNGTEYTNTDQSIGRLVEGMLQRGEVDAKGAEQLSSMLKSRFMNGERAPNEVIQAAKNLSYAGLLGNPFSAMSQFGDAIIQAYVQDTRSAISSVVRSLTGKKFVSMKDFGLADHLAEEFVSTSRTAKFLNKTFKFGLFSAIDRFGKDVALNASIIKNAKLAKTEGGIAELVNRYEKALAPGELKELVKNLQDGEVTDLVRSIAFADLSRTQPISRIELPQAYLDNPNGRLLYQFKTFMLKQMDVVRRDAYNEIKAGNVKQGIKNLLAFGTILGISGATTSTIRDFMLGRDAELDAMDIPLNMLKTFGLSEYMIDKAMGTSKEEAAERREAGEENVRAQKAKPGEAVLGMVTPPVKMFDEIVRADPKAVRYIPIIGPILYEQYQTRKKEKTDD